MPMAGESYTSADANPNGEWGEEINPYPDF